GRIKGKQKKWESPPPAPWPSEEPSPRILRFSPWAPSFMCGGTDGEESKTGGGPSKATNWISSLTAIVKPWNGAVNRSKWACGGGRESEVIGHWAFVIS